MATKFYESIAQDEGLKLAAQVAINSVLEVKENERVLIVTNPDDNVRMISEALYNVSIGITENVSLIFQPTKTQLDFAEDSVIRAIESNPDIFISVSREKLGKDRFRLSNPLEHEGKTYDHIFRYLWKTKKLRSFWSPRVTAKMFRETIPIDYGLLGERCGKVKRILDEAEEVHVTSGIGTDIKIGLRGRKTLLDDGNLRKPGSGGNLPCGEAYISPELGSSSGIIRFDGSIAAHKGVIIVRNPVTLTVEGGRVKEIEGGTEADALEQAVRRGEERAAELVKGGNLTEKEGKRYIRDGRNLGELGIGLNPKARIIGNMLEDEKVFGTCHIALGSNYDDDSRAMIHLDGLIREPNVTSMNKKGKKKKIMEEGRFLL